MRVVQWYVLCFVTEGSRLTSTSNHCIMTLDKLLTYNSLLGRQRETISLISSPGSVKANKPTFGLRKIVIIIIHSFIHSFRGPV